jgi:hypothetical protein
MLYILFYSNYCRHCEKFIQILESSGESTYFAKVCADRDRSTGQRPTLLSTYKIKEVPTIIVENKSLPGLEAFKWLANRLENSTTAVNSMATRHNKNPENVRNSIPNPEDLRAANDVGFSNTLEGFSMNSVSSFSDNCVQLSSMGDTRINTPDESDEVQKTSNFILRDDNITAVAINTPVTSASDVRRPKVGLKKDLLKKKQLDNQYNKLMKEREDAAPRPPIRM